MILALIPSFNSSSFNSLIELRAASISIFTGTLLPPSTRHLTVWIVDMVSFMDQKKAWATRRSVALRGFNSKFPTSIPPFLCGVPPQDFGPFGTALTPVRRVGFPQRKCILKDICTETVFMKYKEEIQVITTVNEFLRFHTNPSNQHYADYYEIRSPIRRFIIRIYGHTVHRRGLRLVHVLCLSVQQNVISG